MSPHPDPNLRPTFLVIGAARSGTTALTKALAQHPEIFITTPKETHFFAFANQPSTFFTGPGDDRMINRPLLTEPDRYLALYTAGRRSPHRGEGSVSTLYHAERAVENIEAYAPDARLVAILRNPVDRAHSAYLYLRKRQFEPLTTFEAGLDAEAERKALGWHHMWQYTELGHYARQLRPFIERFGRERLHVILHDDLLERPHDTIAGVLEHLGAAPHPIDPTPEVNRSGLPGPKAVTSVMRLTRSSPRVAQAYRRFVPASAQAHLESQMLRRPDMRTATRERLGDLYAAELDELEDLVGLDLTAWRRTGR